MTQTLGAQALAEPNSALATPVGIQVLAPARPGYSEILSASALAFLADLERRFRAQREALMRRREDLQARLDEGWTPDFLPETRELREAEWRIAPIPRDLEDRRVEITGPVDRKMIINALNSGASVYMADFEDATTPTWDNLIQGQINLRDAVGGEISHVDAATGKHYRLGEELATLVVRPRGWHLDEAHVRIDGKPMCGALFDFGLFLFHNAKPLAANGTGPYFYLPKLENHLEARLWNDVFVWAQDRLGIPKGTIKATVLIETILAAFEMDEILYELRDHMAGLNCGRWDYIFSFIKKFRARSDCVLPDRDQVSMTRHFMRSYAELTVKTCHRRDAHALGGMAAQIPIRGDDAANAEALAKVRADKEREVSQGHDGTWVAHPGLVALAREVFDQGMPGPNQLDLKRQEVSVTAQDLLRVPSGTITERGLRHNLNVGVLYLESWLRGTGCVPIYNLMEDAATAEISRSQVWQWRHHGVSITDGPVIDETLVRKLLGEEMARIRDAVGEETFAAGPFEEAAELFADLVSAPEFEEFLTLPAYRRVTSLS